MPRKAKPQEQKPEAQDEQARPSIVVEFDSAGSAQFTYTLTGGITPQQVWAAAAELNAWAEFERTAQMRAAKMEKMQQRSTEAKLALTMGGRVKPEGAPQ